MSCLLVLVNALLMQNAGVLQQQIRAMTSSLEEFLKEIFFFPKQGSRPSERSEVMHTDVLSSSCASNLAALFSPQLYVTLSWSLLLWQKSFRKTPGEQNTHSLSKEGGYTHQVYILSSCLYICLHLRAKPSYPAMSCLTLLEVIFCLPYSRLYPNHSQDDKSFPCLLCTGCTANGACSPGSSTVLPSPEDTAAASSQCRHIPAWKGKEPSSTQTHSCSTFTDLYPSCCQKGCVSQWLWSVKCLETQHFHCGGKNFTEKLCQLNSTFGFPFQSGMKWQDTLKQAVQ